MLLVLLKTWEIMTIHIGRFCNVRHKHKIWTLNGQRPETSVAQIKPNHIELDGTDLIRTEPIRFDSIQF